MRTADTEYREDLWSLELLEGDIEARLREFLFVPTPRVRRLVSLRGEYKGWMKCPAHGYVFERRLSEDASGRRFRACPLGRYGHYSVPVRDWLRSRAGRVRRL